LSLQEILKFISFQPPSVNIFERLLSKRGAKILFALPCCQEKWQENFKSSSVLVASLPLPVEAGCKDTVLGFHSKRKVTFCRMFFVKKLRQCSKTMVVN
jgi:hypothetical protein